MIGKLKIVQSAVAVAGWIGYINMINEIPKRFIYLLLYTSYISKTSLQHDLNISF